MLNERVYVVCKGECHEGQSPVAVFKHLSAAVEYVINCYPKFKQVLNFEDLCWEYGCDLVCIKILEVQD